MSLRDQLLAKGLVSNKRAKALDRQAKHERRQKQSTRKKKGQLQREQQAKQAAHDNAQQARVRAARISARDAQTVVDTQARIRSLILGNRIPGRGPVPYYHRTLQSQTLSKLSLPVAVAGWLRAGNAAIVALHHRGQDPEYVVVNAGAARELAELAPHLVLALVTDTEGISGEDERFLQVEWEPSLTAHRVDEPPLA